MCSRQPKLRHILNVYEMIYANFFFFFFLKDQPMRSIRETESESPKAYQALR